MISPSMFLHRAIFVVLAIGSALLAALLLLDFLRNGEPAAGTLAAGRKLYLEHCASCHGANLEGQANWQTPLPSGRLPAPPHDASGHTWHHADRVLFAITKYGATAVVGHGYESDMPGFASVLSDDEIQAVLAFIKNTWPERERRYQQEMTRRDAAERRMSKKSDPRP